MEDIYQTLTDAEDPREKGNTGSPAEKLLSDQVCVDCMDITKGCLENISRPASGAAPLSLSEIRRTSRERPGSLELLSPDLTHTQAQGSAAENSSDRDESDEENEDPELGKAIRRMKRLDRILALKASAEREVKQRSRDQQQRLWGELELQSLRMSRNETENTRRFLALTPDSSHACEDVEFVPVFETEVLDLKCDTHTRHETGERTQLECVGQQVTDAQAPDSRRDSKRRQDFVQRNIELAGASGNSVLLTQQERERIEELLRDLEEEQSDPELLTDPQHTHTHTQQERERIEELLRDLEEEQSDPELLTDPQAFPSSLAAGEGFSPDPSELHSLRHIDSRLQLLLPVHHFLSVGSRCSEHTPSQGSLEEDAGDRVLWDARLRREEEKRLREIQQELQILEERSASCLSEDDLRNLLLECEDELLRSPAPGTPPADAPRDSTLG
ncbi:fibrous sheath-interacting protein 1 [Rhinichthys klamathensis goyatoka]|uniref:fibrous sheath-interacting protein 1 n=1 Tax=Rhinichthys klamathensis goyatoka TaxID=3034132 RepID=UPI0024B4A75F|nr:fibrous sheath-interacting protein 1 [Rhinichthys klamathensis goyatoka]